MEIACPEEGELRECVRNGPSPVVSRDVETATSWLHDKVIVEEKYARYYIDWSCPSTRSWLTEVSLFLYKYNFEHYINCLYLSVLC